MRILALDMATRCGWAFNKDDGTIFSGRKDFSEGCPKGSITVRHPFLLDACFTELDGLMTWAKPEVVIIEMDFARGIGGKLLERFAGVAMALAHKHGAAVVSVMPGTWRKEIFCTGGLSTDDAKAAAIARAGVEDDNEAEAKCILEYGLRTVREAAPKTSKKRKAA
jgi:hypothetical protein